MIGEGRAGKTTLLFNLLGLAIDAIFSTVGIEAFECSIGNILQAEARAGQGWKKQEPQAHLVEEALAAEVGKQKKMKKSREAKAEEKLGQQEPIPSSSVPTADVTTSDSISFPSSLPTEDNPSKTSSQPSSAASLKAKVPSNDFETAPVTDIDAELTMKYLGEFSVGRGMKLSVFDYGGQAVFRSLHQLFLTGSSIYTIVFSLVDLLRGSESSRRSAIEHLQHWIEAVVVHTLNPTTQQTAAVIFVGTHKDVVPAPADHDKASKIIHELLAQRGGGLLRVVPNLKGVGERGVTTHQMFVIDNKAGAADPTLADLRAAVEETAKAEHYVTQTKPVSWLKFADLVRAEVSKGSSFINLQKATDVALSVGIPLRDVEPLLLFLHQSGMLVWFPEASLRDTVILDPMAFFVVPATLIIRKHRPTDDDATHHTSVRSKSSYQLYIHT